MALPDPHLASESPGPEAFPCLQAEYARRQRRFLRMLASQHEDPVKFPRLVPAMARKFLADRDVTGADKSKAWVRLRTPPSDEWHRRVTGPVKDGKKSRAEKKATLWTDDPVTRDDGLWIPGEEDVNVVAARLVIPVLEAAASMEAGLEESDEDAWNAPRFPPEILAKIPAPDERATAKELVRIISDLAVVQMVGGDTHGKAIGDVLLARVEHIVLDAGDVLRVAAMPRLTILDPISGQPLEPADLILRVKPGLTAFLKTLHERNEEIPAQERGAFVARWQGRFPGVDPGLLLDAFGLEHSSNLLQLRHLYRKTQDISRIVDLHAWIATLAQQPSRDALPALSDLLAFHGEPSWSVLLSSWSLTRSDTSFIPPDPARAESLADGDDTLYRTLVCKGGKRGPEDLHFFRLEPGPMVPPGWSWPANDPNFVYWWIAILKSHCAGHLLMLKETADFHATDLLRFCCLFDLFGANPDTRVPRYVAESIKASLLHFKYWFDEPGARNDKDAEMTFWSENHQIQFHASQFLVGQLFPDDVFPRSGLSASGKPVTGRDHLERGRERLERWLDRRLALGFSEWSSPGYYNEDVPPVLNVVDFSLDERLATKAALVVDLLVFDLARNTCRGSFGVSAGRAYFEHKGYGWEQSVGETVEVLFGSRGDHLRRETTAIALCTSPKYRVPDALLAIGRDRLLLDRRAPMAFRSRVSINTDEAREHGVGFESDADAAFWWGLGAYFDPDTMELTRKIAARYPNLSESTPLSLLFKLDFLAGYLKALLLDTAEMVAGGAGAAASSLLIMAPFPLNLAAGTVYITSIELMIEGLINVLEDVAVMIKNGLEAAWNALSGQDPPKPDIPQPALQRAWEAMLKTFNAGNVLSRANLYTYSVGDAMLSSVQNHRAQMISLQKQPWLASLGCDACVWTNAPMDPGGSIGSAGWEVFKHLATCQVGRVFGDVAGVTQVGLDDLKGEGLRDWGGSICLPKIAQYRGASIIAYQFPSHRSEFSATFTHAWFPCDFFDEVTPAPENDAWLPGPDGGGTWVFARKDDGYVALCSARRVRWLRDERFSLDPDPASDRTIGEGRFTSTELRADDGSNIWVCAIGNRTQFGSFERFASRIRDSYLHFSGPGELGQLQCTFDMPSADGTGEPGFRWELFFGDDEAHLNGVVHPLDDYPRFEGRYVEGRASGRVEWRETSYKIVHPVTGLWVSHDITRARREPGPPQRCAAHPQPRSPRLEARSAVALTPRRAAAAAAAADAPTASPPRRPGRSTRFRLEPKP